MNINRIQSVNNGCEKMDKLFGSIDGEMITHEFFLNCSEKEINCGDCMIWAYIAYHLYKNVKLWSNHAHAFVEQNGKFYDSESPQGIKRWQNLDCNSRCKIVHAQELSLKDFKNFWAKSNIDWKFWDKEIHKFMQKNNKSKLIEA
jgi:hypothetical protein